MIRNILLRVLCVLFLVLGTYQSTLAKDYTIPVIRVEVTVHPDGSVRIIEHRTYVFDDDFSWADYRLPTKGFTSIENIMVSENGRNYLNKNSEAAGTFLVNRDSDEVQIKWFYNAENEERTFTIAYTLKGAIVSGPEWAEFFWNYISADREKDTDSLQIALQLPSTISSDSLFVWKRCARSKINLQQTAAGYSVTAADLDDDESVHIRSVFPRNILSQNAEVITDNNFSLAWAQQDENRYQAEQARLQKRRARLAAYGEKLIVVVMLLSTIAFVFFYRRYGKRYSNNSSTPEETMLIPGRLQPAVAGWLLMKRNIGSAQLMATLLDLARRRYFIIKEQEPEKKWLSGEKKIFTIEKSGTNPQDELTDWEADLAGFINEQIENDNPRIDKLFSESSYKASKWFSSWKKKLKNHCKTYNWYDQESYTGVYANVAIQLVLLIAGVIATIWAGPIGIAAIMITTGFLIGSFGIIRRTPEGERTYNRWKAYRKGLKNAEGYTVERDMLDKHFIYAMSFGLSKDEIETLFNRCSESDIAFYWFVFYGNTHHSAADIAGTFSTLGASGAAAFPGAAGGAGATAGAAGGGAAGGAG